ncbi:toxin-antitoxin system HicB family antitoxin [Paraburkholderia silviterrae]|uniref:Type II toxin-antitoxin system HicB family antitoxin n=1 Tax=Paraburkholderia silviterrae TaxID=2528715 RepID=A0A4R5ME43_9BURK|nr:type II toxin-antitoxin system HicB family antitoxin [Paraburkholderia silviterrae]TDG25329.1 type II toxin-antitoxin system HicB family antitoxin [Paraburkholderia silviterrae]
MNNPDRYPAEVFWSDEDEGFIAIAPDLPGCSAFGEDEASALAELKHAIAAWKEAAASAGNPIPPPSRPAEVEYSGKFLLRVPKSMHRNLAVSAQREGVSLNQYLVTLIASAQSLHVVQERLAVLHTQPSHAKGVVMGGAHYRIMWEAVRRGVLTGVTTSTEVVEVDDLGTFVSNIHPMVYTGIGGARG